jgi:hypothetical protein
MADTTAPHTHWPDHLSAHNVWGSGHHWLQLYTVNNYTIYGTVVYWMFWCALPPVYAVSSTIHNVLKPETRSYSRRDA